MAEWGQTLRVSGLPTDIEDDRLKDKLFIHFLRKRNGGGEIESVTIIKAMPGCALVTFEDSRVAQRVIQHSQHALEVDGKKYKVTVTEHRESLEPDEVILSLSATVNCSQLPGGNIALTTIHQSHPDIQINYHSTENLCTVQGDYSKVQAALAQLLRPLVGPQAAETYHINQPPTSASVAFQTEPRPNSQDLEDHSRKPHKQRLQREDNHPEYNPSSYGHAAPGGYSSEDTLLKEGAAFEYPAEPEEDFSLIVDADMYQYLKRHCQKEYQKILSKYGVSVVDVTNQGLTTLFLQVETGISGDSLDQERLKLAKKYISRFYQENESKIRRDQLPKNILLPRGGVQRAMESLSVRLPKLLVNEDEQNIYIIGSSSDVSKAKHFLLVEYKEEKDDVASLLRYPSYDRGSPAGVPAVTASPDPVDDRLDQLFRLGDDERRDDGARRYKLAARFKDSGLATLSKKPFDFTLRGETTPKKQAHVGPMLGHGEGVPRAQPQNTGEDILFRSRDAFVRNKTTLTDTRPKGITSPLSMAQLGLSGSSSLPPVGSGTSLRRTSSFSGMPQKKAEVIGQKSQEDPGKTSSRSPSFSNKPEVFTAEITVSSMMWQHIKEAYSARVEDLTSDVQVKESDSKGGMDMTVTLRGANRVNVSSSLQGLQRLVDSVAADFTLQEVKLSELGITDRTDENLQACCAEVRCQFKKVTIHVLSTSVFLCGPKKLCSEVGASLREVFSGVFTPNLRVLYSSSSSKCSPSRNEDLRAGLQGYSSLPAVLDSPVNVGGSSQERRANQRIEFHEEELTNGPINKPSMKKDPVIKEKVKVVGTAEIYGHMAKMGNDKSVSHVNGEGSTATTDEDKKEETSPHNPEDSAQQSQTHAPEESRSAVGGSGGICLCGERENLTAGSKCGATFCSKCLVTVHSQCQVCHEDERTPWGIQGKMKTTRIHLTVPGYKKDSAIKITYSIPDGIQGEGHPSPGKAFKGGIFEAFFPDCEEARKLLPRLEKAFKKGLTFTVMERETGAKVLWDCIPHKTSTQGGKPANGYPDSTYLSRLSKALTSKGIEETSTKSSE